MNKLNSIKNIKVNFEHNVFIEKNVNGGMLWKIV